VNLQLIIIHSIQVPYFLTFHSIIIIISDSFNIFCYYNNSASASDIDCFKPSGLVGGKKRYGKIRIRIIFKGFCNVRCSNNHIEDWCLFFFFKLFIDFFFCLSLSSWYVFCCAYVFAFETFFSSLKQMHACGF